MHARLGSSQVGILTQLSHQACVCPANLPMNVNWSRNIEYRISRTTSYIIPFSGTDLEFNCSGGDFI